MKNQRGITLIALIVTIVILILLSGIRIVTEYNDKGVINKAKEARMLAEQQEIEEKYERLKVFDKTNLIDIPKTIKKLIENFDNIKINDSETEELSCIIVITGNYGTYSYSLDSINGFVKVNEIPISYGKAYALILDTEKVDADGNKMYDMVFTRSDDYEIEEGKLYSKSTKTQITEYNPKGVFNGKKTIIAVYTDFENKYYNGEGIVPEWHGYEYKSKIKSVNFEKIIKPISIARWFQGMSGCENIDITNLDTQNTTNMKDMFGGCVKLAKIQGLLKLNTKDVKNMYGMFASCKTLKSIDLSKFDTSQVTDMGYMFSSCDELEDLNLSNFNTNKVTNMHRMFQQCKSLKKLDLSNFDTLSVKDMGNMFYQCTNLINLDLSSFNTMSVTNMSWMFASCENLRNLDISKFDTLLVTNMSNMFSSCYVLTQLDVSNFNTSNVKNMERMFYDCKALTELDVSNFNTSNVNFIKEMFSWCANLTQLDVSKFDTSNVGHEDAYYTYNEYKNYGTMTGMFANCKKLTTIGDLTGWDTSNVRSMENMFYDCRNLIEIDVSKFNTSSVGKIYSEYKDGTKQSYGNMKSMFYKCEKLKKLDVSSFNTENVTNMKNMFKTCAVLKELDVSKFNTKKVTDMTSMFSECFAITTIGDLTKTYIDENGETKYYWDTSKVTNMPSMFNYCNQLVSLDLSKLKTEKVKDMSYMFNNCNALTSVGDLSGWNTTSVTNMAQMFYNCRALRTLDVSNFNTSNVDNMRSMFNSCRSITKLDVSGFDTSKVTTMSNMFDYCIKVQNLDVSGFKTSKVTNMNRMFAECNAVETIGDLTGWDTSNVFEMNGMFAGCSSLEKLDLSKFDTSNVGTEEKTRKEAGYNIYGSFDGMFARCYKLESVGDLSNWDTSKVRSMGYMFYQCYSLTDFGDISGWNTSSVGTLLQYDANKDDDDIKNDKFGTMQQMFFQWLYDSGDTETKVDCSKWNVDNVENYKQFSDYAKNRVIEPEWKY